MNQIPVKILTVSQKCRLVQKSNNFEKLVALETSSEIIAVAQI